jgi:hypothetical protein
VSESFADFIEKFQGTTVFAPSSEWQDGIEAEIDDTLLSNLEEFARHLSRDLENDRIKQVPGLLFVGGSASDKQAAVSALTKMLNLRSVIIDVRELEALDGETRAERLAEFSEDLTHVVVLLHAEAIVSADLYDAIDRRPKNVLLVGTADDRALTEGPLGKRFRSRLELRAPDGVARGRGFGESLRNLARSVGLGG